MSTICAVCNGQCCRSLPIETAKKIVVDVVTFDPELGNLTLRGINSNDGKVAICSFWNEDDGCVLELNDRPSICSEFQCDLLILAEVDPIMVESCSIYGRIEMNDVWSMHDWKVFCHRDCSHKDKCQVPCKTEEVENEIEGGLV